MKGDVGIILRPPTTTALASSVQDEVENGQSQNKFTVQHFTIRSPLVEGWYLMATSFIINLFLSVSALLKV